jgi:hypothetical protein
VEREVVQFVVDSLAGVNLLLEAKIQSGYIPMDDLKKIQEINRSVMKKVRQ